MMNRCSRPCRRPVDLSAIDVLVLGSGNAGLSAALVACEYGARVVVLESSPRHMRGGNSRHAGTCRCMHDQPIGILDDAYSEAEYWDDLMRVTGGQTSEELARMTIRQSAACPQFMMRHGVRFQSSLCGTGEVGRISAYFLGGGRALVNELSAAAERAGVGIVYDAEVSEVHLDGDTFTSVTATVDGKPARIAARALIAACGGFESNLDWLAQSWGPGAANFSCRGTPHNTGKVLKSLLAQGVQSIGDPAQWHAIAIDARAPKFDGGIVTRLHNMSLGIVVNKHARRFHDEGEAEAFWPKRHALWGRLVAQQPEQIAYLIVDGKVSGGFIPSVFPPFCAGTIGQLANMVGLPEAELVRTVAEYNAAVRPGTFNPEALDDCATSGLTTEKSHWALALDTPPYRVYPMRPAVVCTYLGVGVNARAQVLMADGRPARNMYAAGAIMAVNVLREGYLGGIGMTIGSVFGRAAGHGAGTHVAQ